MESFKEKVEKRAYELYLARGGVDGNHIQDWKQAEKEIREEEKKAADVKKREMEAAKEKQISKEKAEAVPPKHEAPKKPAFEKASAQERSEEHTSELQS